MIAPLKLRQQRLMVQLPVSLGQLFDIRKSGVGKVSEVVLVLLVPRVLRDRLLPWG